MNHLIKFRSLTATFSYLRLSRTLACLSGALFLIMASILWQPGEPAQAYGRLTVNATDAETFSLPEAKVGSAYEFQFQTEGGLAPLKWQVVAGAIPPGLKLEENGILRGAPGEAKAEAYAFVVEVTDSAMSPQRFSLPCSLLVNAPRLRIVTSAPKLRIVTRDNGNSPNATVVNNHLSGGPVDTLIADVSDAAVVETRPAANAPPRPASAQPSSLTLKTPLIAGKKVLEGAATAAGDVIVTIISQDGSSLTSPPLPLNGGKFSFQLTKALALGDQAFAQQGSGPQLVRSATVAVEKAPLLPAQLTQPRNGDMQIEVTGKKGQKIAVLVEGERVHLACKDASGKTQRCDNMLFILPADGVNVVPLFDPLKAPNGEKMALLLIDTDGREATSNEVPIKGSDLYDWGRVRAYFSAGVIFSKERESFSQQDFMLSFNLDKTWWQSGARTKSPFKHFNTFFDTRLTSIPVVTSSPTPTPRPDGMTSTSAQNLPEDNQQCKDTPLGGFDCFLASRKVALMQVGGYVPIYFNFMKWDYKKHDNVVFFAPLAKMGIQTITSEETSRLNTVNNNDENNRLNGDSVYNFFALGARLGHFKLLDRNASPELISYLDLTAGKWENFDLVKGQPCDDPANKGAFECDNGVVKLGGNRVFIRERKFRMGFEGRLKIPETPLFVGFDANLGKGPDDLRFVFGTRFDVGTLFGRLKLP